MNQSIRQFLVYVPVVYAWISSWASLCPSMTNLFLIFVIPIEGVTSSTPMENPLSPVIYHVTHRRDKDRVRSQYAHTQAQTHPTYTHRHTLWRSLITTTTTTTTILSTSTTFFSAMCLYKSMKNILKRIKIIETPKNLAHNLDSLVILFVAWCHRNKRKLNNIFNNEMNKENK